MIPLNGDPARVFTASQKDHRDHGAPQISPDGATIAFEAETSYHSRVVKLRPSSP
jgi:Tol biopolymer transport system component